jgi:Rrf2 family iron-sulfur cluster assembly transcriptional regulator
VLSQTAEYALRAVLHLAAHEADQPGAPLAVGDIAHALGVPRNYLSKTLHQLARAGVVASTVGPGGGFRLGVPAEALPLEAVVAPFSNALERECLLGRTRCSDAAPCVAHHRWKSVADRIQDFFAGTTVADVLRRDGGPPAPSRAPRRRTARAR